MEIYANAPVREAALDIRIRAPKDLLIDQLAVAKDERYPNLFQKSMATEVKLETDIVTKLTSARKKDSISGFGYKTLDGLNVFQARLDGFTHNRLAPYQEWDLFVAEAKRLWKTYKAAARPEIVELIGLNYLNEIQIPVGSEMKDYFESYIEVPKQIPQLMNVFSSAYQVTIPDEGGFLQISQSYGVPQKEGHATINLNIQTFKPVLLSIDDNDDLAMWELFEILRKAKSKAFEACITDKVRVMIR